MLEVKRGSSSVIISNPKGGLNQLWDLDYGGTIRSSLGLVMDVRQEKTQAGAPVIVFSKHVGWNQIFRIVPFGW